MCFYKCEVNKERGTAMVEFALVSMVLLLILVGIIQFGLVFNTQLMLENAARDGARFVAMPVNRSDGEIKSFIISTVPSIPLTASNISISPLIRQAGQPVTVTITYTYQIPVTFGVLPESYTLRAQTVMMKE